MLNRDPDQARATRAAHERFLESGGTSPAARVRDLVAQSWRRSVAAGVDVDHGAVSPVLEGSGLIDYREAHPLSRVFPLLYDVLGRTAEQCDVLMAVGDSDGRLLWVCGPRTLVARAESINFAEGTIWDEAHAGTNAPGTALQLDAPVQIHAAEHFTRPVQAWSCSAAPIHDPVTSSILGIVDITGGDDVASPQTMSMVRAAARMAEAELGRLIAVQAATARPATATSTSTLWAPTHPAAGMTLDALGRPDCQLTVGTRTQRLSPRHSEIMVLLVEHPEGLTGDQLAVGLYPDDVPSSTVRAELTRLRALLGADQLASRPYRLEHPPTCDWLRVSDLLSRGRVAEALRTYGGPLLPQSDAPGVVERRTRLQRDLRAAVLNCAELDLMLAWTRSRWGADDVEMWRHQVRLLPADSPLRPLAQAEVRRLDHELGVPRRD